MRATTAQLFAYTHVRSRTWLVQLSHLGACRRLQRVQQTAQCAATAGTPFSSVARYVAWFAYIPGVVPVSFLLSLPPPLFVTANRPITTIRSGERTVPIRGSDCQGVKNRSSKWCLAGTRPPLALTRISNLSSSLNSLSTFRYFDYSIGCYPLGKNATSVRRAPIFTRGLRYSVKRA